jgi:large subunit ribosomal protein L20
VYATGDLIIGAQGFAKEYEMARVKSGPHGYKRHKKILKLNKGYYGTKSKLFRRANEQYLKSQWYAYRDRRVRKRDLRKLWIARINAAARQNGTTYSRFIHGMRKTEINLNRKMLADLAVREPEVFTAIVEKAMS